MFHNNIIGPLKSHAFYQEAQQPLPLLLTQHCFAKKNVGQNVYFSYQGPHRLPSKQF